MVLTRDICRKVKIFLENNLESKKYLGIKKYMRIEKYLRIEK